MRSKTPLFLILGLAVLTACDPLPPETGADGQALEGPFQPPMPEQKPETKPAPVPAPAPAPAPPKQSKPLPDRCVLAPGTEQGSAEWLEWWRCKAMDVCDIGDFVNAVGACPREIDLAAIEAACEGLPTRAERFQCVMEKVHDAVEALEAADRAEDRYVCRHYSACANKVLDAMGDTCNFEGGSVPGHGGHAWCEVTDDETGGTLVGDPYNEICYWVPREGVLQRVCRFVRIGR